MQIPKGTNLEMLAQMPAFFEQLVRKNEDLERKVAELEGKKQPDKYDDSKIKSAIAGISDKVSEIKPYDDSEIKQKIATIKPYDDTDLRKELEKAVAMCRRDDSTYRELAGQMDNLHKKLLKTCDSARYDDSDIRTSIKELSVKLDKIKPYDDSKAMEEIKSLSSKLSKLSNYDDKELREKIFDAMKVVSSIKNYDDSTIKKELSAIKQQVAEIKPYRDKNLVTQITKISDRINFVEKALGVK